MLRQQPGWKWTPRPSRQLSAIVGIDEVGRGAWAGPVVAAAVILPRGTIIDGLADSKVLSLRRRHLLDRHIRQAATAIGIGWVAAEEVDSQGLSWAVRESGLRALAGLNAVFELVLLDGSHNYLADSHPSQAIIKADAQIVPVAAASVIAKVARDRYMARLSQRYTGYGFERHVGYGTAAHRQALATLGVCPLHRRSFAPLRELSRVG